MAERDTIVKLAEAMGIDPLWFDPFASAADDYAVLQWMRNNSDLSRKFNECLEFFAWNYKLGDYARAAMNVLGLEVE